MTKFETLRELTGQESGIVVRGDSVIVANWSSSCPDGGLPLLAPWGTDLISWPTEINIAKQYNLDDIRDALPGTLDDMDIVYDYNGEIPALWGHETGNGAIVNTDNDGNLIPTSGKIYELDDGTIIIAPEGWC